MGDVVRASFEGLDELAALAADQQRYVEAVRTYVEDACGRVGAFTGLLGLFRDSYAHAHTTVVTELAHASKGASDVSTAFATTVATYRHHDRKASHRMQDLRERIEQSAGPERPEAESVWLEQGVHGEKFGVAAAERAETTDKRVQSFLEERLGKTPTANELAEEALKGSPWDVVALANDFSVTISAGESISEGEEDEARYREFASAEGGE